MNNLINLSFTTGVFPNIAKIAKIVPLYKKENKLECNNYEPIFLLSNIGNLLKNSSTKCLFDSQFRFRPHHSTNHVLITITKHIRSALDKNNFNCGVLLDFQKPFDTVNHGILLSKLSYGVRCIAHDLFKSYLTNRKQHTIINGVSSSVLSITTHGVLQGSVLGLFLFLCG